MFDLSRDEFSCCFLNPIDQRLIVGKKKIFFFSHVNESSLNRRGTSHFHPICRMIYNRLFELIVSADENSTIQIWNINNGEKLMHIRNAHLNQFDEIRERNVQITSMIFDENQRRLITAATDGSLALWNFNNGQNLTRFQPERAEAKEITSLIHENERLFVAGWSKKIRIFLLTKSTTIRLSSFSSLHNFNNQFSKIDSFSYKQNREPEIFRCHRVC